MMDEPADEVGAGFLSMAIRQRVDVLARQFPFATNVVSLASGTVLGQAITIIALPVLTRLYSPDAFGLLGIYMSVLMVISPAVCGRLELAIPLPEHDEDAIHLLAISIMSATFVSAVLAVVVVTFPRAVAALLRQASIEPFLWMIPLGLWLTGLYSAIQFWSIRKRRYGDVAFTQLVRALGGSGAQVSFGAFGWSPFGLLFGYLVYSGMGSFRLARLLWLRERRLLGAITWSGLRRNLWEQRQLPLFSVPESLFNAAAINLPLVMIASIAGAREAGFMLLAQRVTSIPIGLLGTNISRVYLVEGAERHRKGELGHFTRKLMRHLLLLGTGPFLALAILAPVVFPLVFGTEWHRAGVMVRWTVPYMLLQFVASPVSTIMTVTHKQHISFFLQLFGFTLIVAAIGLASWVAPKFSFEFFSVAAAVYYAVYVAVVLRHASATAGALGFGR